MPTRPKPSNRPDQTSSRLATRTADVMLDKKALEVTIMDVRGLTSVTDFFVLGTGESDVQVKAIVDHLRNTMKGEGTRPYHIEGYDNLSWVLIDLIDVVAHVFLPETRAYYGLERLWADAKISSASEEAGR